MSPTRFFDRPLIDNLNSRYWAELGGHRGNVLSLRLRRSLSWLTPAVAQEDDPDSVFIFCWIAFNALYVEDSSGGRRDSERQIFDAYFSKIIGLDENNAVYSAIWQNFTGPIRVLLNNRYVFEPFWKHYNGVDGYENWETRFEASKRRVRSALATTDTVRVLTTMFDRLYVLRNQMIHGGATWDGSVNRRQVNDGAAIMAFLVPLFIELMMDNPKEDWGKPYYPSIDFDADRRV